jgi:aminopeptidase N
MGNGGYDVTSYDVFLAYQESGSVRSSTKIESVADTDGGTPASGLPLGRFNLDFRGPEVVQVLVDGAPAQWNRAGQELRITPAEPIADGTPFETIVRYEGRPRQISNPDGSEDGWTETSDGVVALGEPQAVPSFLPVSDHPTDKALWEIELRVPERLTGISNGLLQGDIIRSGGKTATRWTVNQPMASYLVVIAIGRFRVDRGVVRGTPYLAAVDRSFKRSSLDALADKTREAHRFLEDVAGPYPFDATGGLIDPAALGFALENQTRSYYPSSPGLSLVIHEVAHQWYGDSVSVAEWDEIWLNEGFATYMEWLFEEENGGESAAERLAREYENNGPGAGVWNPAPADPEGPENLFDDSVYDRGAMALQVLRQEIGNADFREVLERWAQENEFGNVTTEDLYDLIDDVTGAPRPDLFDEWLYEPGKPSCPSC